MELLKERPDITKLIESVTQQLSMNNCAIIKAQTNEKGEGFLGQIFMVTVKDGNSDKTLELVIKAAFMDEKIRNITSIKESFSNEIHFYTEIYPAFKKFESDRNVLTPIDFVPKCYKVDMDDGKELLCLENLKPSNFEVFDKKVPLDDDHISLIFDTYGRFHAYSFALQEKSPELYAKLVSKCYNVLVELLNNPNSPGPQHMRDNMKLGRSCLVPGEDDDVIKKYEKYVEGDCVKMLTEITTEKFDHHVILHGDCWSNNMMFKYEKSEEGKKLIDMRLLDLQLVKSGSPVCDLSYCLYSSGAPKQIFDYLDKYLHIYYKSFLSFCVELGSNPEKLFSFETLKQHWKKYSRYGMILGITIVKMKLINKEDILDMTNSLDEDFDEKVANVKYNEEQYNKQIRDLLRHMFEIDAL